MDQSPIADDSGELKRLLLVAPLLNPPGGVSSPLNLRGCVWEQYSCRSSAHPGSQPSLASFRVARPRIAPGCGCMCRDPLALLVLQPFASDGLETVFRSLLSASCGDRRCASGSIPEHISTRIIAPPARFGHANFGIPTILKDHRCPRNWSDSRVTVGSLRCEIMKKPAVMRVSGTSWDFVGSLLGGLGRNRTGVRGFAVRCMTTLPPGRMAQQGERNACSKQMRARDGMARRASAHFWLMCRCGDAESGQVPYLATHIEKCGHGWPLLDPRAHG